MCQPAELIALRAAVGAFVAQEGRSSLTIVAQAAKALDDLRGELVRADALIAEQQDQIAKLYDLFTGWEDNGD